MDLVSDKEREKVKYLDRISVPGKTPETQEKPEKWSILKSFSKILKNNKYYLKIFGEIGFQKFNIIFIIKILKSTVDTGLYRVGRILIKSEKFQKMLERRKYNSKKKYESGI